MPRAISTSVHAVQTFISSHIHSGVIPSMYCSGCSLSKNHNAQMRGGKLCTLPSSASLWLMSLLHCHSKLPTYHSCFHHLPTQLGLCAWFKASAKSHRLSCALSLCCLYQDLALLKVATKEQVQETKAFSASKKHVRLRLARAMRFAAPAPVCLLAPLAKV